MKRAVKNSYLYQVYDNDTLIFQGTVREVASHFYFTNNAIYQAYKKQTKFLNRYTVKRIDADFITKPYLILNEAIKHYGNINQINSAINNLDNLNKQLTLNLQGEDNKEAIIETLANAYMTLDQIKIIYDIKNSDITNYKKIKLDELSYNIKKDKMKENC